MAQTIEQLKQLVATTTDEQIAGMTSDDRKAFFARRMMVSLDRHRGHVARMQMFEVRMDAAIDRLVERLPAETKLAVEADRAAVATVKEIRL